MVVQQPVELVSERTKRSSLNLDQSLRWHVLVANDVDDEASTWNLEHIPWR